MNFLHRTQELFQRLRTLGATGILQLTGALALAAFCAAPASASTAYGDLNNFDVFNDTGQDCHGFEIELDGVHSTDITYTFDWNHYGAPTITEDTSDPLNPKVFVRYAAKYAGGTFSAFTAQPSTPPAPTTGHMCTDPSVNFGCEHFGVGYYGAPTVVRYNWLIESPPASGTLIHGPAVNVATPSWTYFPPAPAQPVAQVQAVILAPPPPPAPVYEFGDAVWVKAIVTTSHNNGAVELKDLVSDDPADPNDKNWKNGEPDEVEIEWQILQTEFNNPAGANNDLAGGNEDLPGGDEVVTRRYEFYKYTGPLDPETNEALCDNYPQVSDPASPKYKAQCDPNPPSSVTVLGDYIGAQMAGFNVAAVLGLIDHVQDGNLNEPYVARTVVVGGNTPYVTQVTAGALPTDVTIDSATGVLSGTPSTAGVFSFTVTATDADSAQVSKPYTMTIAGPADPCDGVVCSASDACHDVGVCDPATGICSDPTKPDDTGCDDGDACTQTDSCQAGVCIGANPVSCSVSDQCHVAGTCDPATGACSNPTAADGAPCNDGNTCSQSDTCQAGVCIGANPVSCTASDQCHVAGTCDPATGACSNPTAADGAPCNDGNACSQSDTCQAGVCIGANPVSCTASDQCHVAGICDPATGACSNPTAADGAPCSDGNACSQSDTCQAGACIGANPVSCTASDQCHVAGTCDPATGACSNPTAADGAPCSDGNACSQSDTCQAGACIGANPVSCTASDQCHVAGTCDPASGACSNPTAADGAPCSDGNACSQSDTCQAGACIGANPVSCTASDQCHVAGTCDPATGACSNPAAPNGSACNDGDACTQTDTCQAGVCTGANLDPSCVSARADLSLKLAPAPKHEQVGRKIKYGVKVKNDGPDPATLVTADFSCSGVPYHIVRMSKGCVATGRSVECALGTLATHQSDRINITIVAEAPGLLTCTVGASSATPDPDPADQSKTVETRIR